jgi:chemotaxis protein CheD
MANLQAVGLGVQVISRDSQDVLVAYGLGSCLGIGMYDPSTHIAGLLHAVLPEHPGADGVTPQKFVDSGVVSLIDGMVKAGADRRKLVIWMAGGANMILSLGALKSFDIGSRNIQAAFKVFDALKLRLSGQEVGGNSGRTVRVYVGEGRMTVRKIGEEEHDITISHYEKQVSQGESVLCPRF